MMFNFRLYAVPEQKNEPRFEVASGEVEAENLKAAKINVMDNWDDRLTCSGCIPSITIEEADAESEFD